MRTKNGMNNRRYRHMMRAAIFVRDSERPLGNTDIAKHLGVSRQAANSIMMDAERYGYVSVEIIQWRKNATAKRYTAGRYASLLANRWSTWT